MHKWQKSNKYLYSRPKHFMCQYYDSIMIAYYDSIMIAYSISIQVWAKKWGAIFSVFKRDRASRNAEWEGGKKSRYHTTQMKACRGKLIRGSL